MGITMQDVVSLKIQPVTTTSALIQNELDNSYNDQLRLKDILMPATTQNDMQGKKKFSFNVKDDRCEPLNQKGLKQDQYNKHASLISFKNHKVDVSYDSKKNKQGSGKKQQKAVTPVKSSQKINDARSGERAENLQSTKKTMQISEAQEKSKEREKLAQQRLIKQVALVQSTKNSKNKLSLKVNIPTNGKPTSAVN